MAIYKLLKDPLGDGTPCGVRLKSENKGIPFDPDNTDYQEYLAWVDKGNKPDPADEEE